MHDLFHPDRKEKLKRVDSDFIEEKLNAIVTKEKLNEHDCLVNVTDDEGIKEIEVTQRK